MQISLVVVFLTVLVANPVSAQFNGQCPPGMAANEYDSWKWIQNAAVRTADRHAVDHNPAASFIISKVSANYQFGGDHAGEYLVMVRSESQPVSFAVLKPMFNFCSDPSGLDDSRNDLFEVVSAKLDGRRYWPK